MVNRWAVLPFDGGTAKSKSTSVRGGKGLSLAEMTELGLPVPPGFTIASGVCRAFFEHHRLPRRVHAQIARELKKVERQTGRQFGNPENPLLVSVRSGAEESMPGMMDTILNVGINVEQRPVGLQRLYGKRFTWEIIDRFQEQWWHLRRECLTNGAAPADPNDQLLRAIEAVFLSWESERAIAYRQTNGIPGWKGTAVTIQAMVFGNRDEASCTGVVFSADVTTGESGLYGEFLPVAQGEELVSGRRTPRPIAEFAEWNAALDTELRAYVDRLADYYGGVVDVEFTVESGVLYILQVRRAKLPLLVQVTRLVHDVWAGRITREEAAAAIPYAETFRLRRLAFAASDIEEAERNQRVIARGLAASPGAAYGVIARTAREACDLAKEGAHVIFVREDTCPSDLPAMLVAKAIVTSNGGATCHAAIVARELGLPAVVGVRGQLTGHFRLSVDGTRGIVVGGRLPLLEPELPKEANIYLRWSAAYWRRRDGIDFSVVERLFSANQFLNDYYLTDVLVRKVKGTHLEEVACKLREATHWQIAGVLVAYLFLAVQGEVRHYFRETKRETCAEVERIQSIHKVKDLASYGRGVAQRRKLQERLIPAACHLSHEELIEITALAVVVFRGNRWDSAFGGPAWVAIAETLLRFLKGELSHSLFIDVVFDLEHNGGSVFDKHHMFTRRSCVADLRRQLEIKKRLSDPDELYRKLCDYSPCSDEVAAAWKLSGKEGSER